MGCRRRGSHGWLGTVLLAVTLAGCTFGTRQAHARSWLGVVEGGVMGCSGEPKVPMPAAIELDGVGTKFSADAVPRNGRYRIRGVTRGRYTLSALTSQDSDSWSVTVRERVTNRNIWGCLPTVGGPYRPATPAEVKRFFRRADNDNATFTATYENLSDNFPPTVWSWTQQSQGDVTSSPPAWHPHGEGNFVFRSHTSKGSLAFIQQDRGTYLCTQRHHRRWYCSGSQMQISSIGDWMFIQQFNREAIAIDYQIGAPPNRSWIWRGTIHSIPATCLRYPDNQGGRITWCISSTNVTVFDGSPTSGGFEVLQLSDEVPLTDFKLPSRPHPWDGWAGVCANEVPTLC